MNVKQYVTYNEELNCYVFEKDGETFYLRAKTYHPALCEADEILADIE